MFQQAQNLFANLVINSHEKSNTHNFHNVFIYNTQLLDPNPFSQVLFLLVLYSIKFFSWGHVPNLWSSTNTAFRLHYIFNIAFFFQVVNWYLIYWQIWKFTNTTTFFNSFNLKPLNTTWFGHVDTLVTWKNIQLC